MSFYSLYMNVTLHSRYSFSFYMYCTVRSWYTFLPRIANTDPRQEARAQALACESGRECGRGRDRAWERERWGEGAQKGQR